MSTYTTSIGKEALAAVTRAGGPAGLDPAVVGNAFRYLKDRVGTLESARATGQTIGESFDSSSDVLSLDPAKRLSEVYKQLREQQYQFFREGGVQYDQLNNEVTKLGDSFQAVSTYAEKFYGNAKDGKAVMGELYQSFRGFVGVTSQTATSLGKLALGFKRLGLDTKSFGRILDNAALSYGLNEKQLLSMSTALYDLRENFKMSPNEIAQNFQTAQKSFAYSADKMMNVFTKLQKTSRQTGVQFGTLTSAFGDTMDTFQGSANVAGKLNAVLGKSVFNSMDLLRKTESERLETIVQGLQRSLGRNISQVGKFELKAIAASMGVSVDDARRLLMNKGNIRENIDKVIQSPQEKLGNSINNLSDVNKRLIETNHKLLESFKSLLSPGERFRIEAGGEFSVPKARGFGQVLIEQAMIPATAGTQARQNIKTQVQNFMAGTGRQLTPMDLSNLAGLLFQIDSLDERERILKSDKGFSQMMAEARKKANVGGGDRASGEPGTMSGFSRIVVDWYKNATISERSAFDTLRRKARSRGGAGLEQAVSMAFIRQQQARMGGKTGAQGRKAAADEFFKEGFETKIGPEEFNIPAPGKIQKTGANQSGAMFPKRADYESQRSLRKYSDDAVNFGPGIASAQSGNVVSAAQMAVYTVQAEVLAAGLAQAFGFANITNNDFKKAAKIFLAAAGLRK